jgi:nitroreductase
MTSPLETLLSAAVRAPSGDNTQPWRFVVDPREGVIALLVDETRDPSPMNAGQRMARIALGAALQNVLETAQRSGWRVELAPADPPALAAVRLVGSGGPPGEVPQVLTSRVTNRRLYDARPVPPDVLARLAQQTPELDGVRTRWVTGADRLKQLAELIGRADATMFGEPSMRAAFLAKVRFDAPADAEVEEGLPLNSLVLSRGDRLALKVMRRVPGWLLKLAGGLKAFARKARQLVESSSGLCVIVAPGKGLATDLTVGRAMQRAWLALAGEGLAVQPMMSLAVLENVLDNGTADLVASLGRERLEALCDDLRAKVPELEGGRLGFLMRFGYAERPSGRTGRLPLGAVVRERWESDITAAGSQSGRR